MSMIPVELYNTDGGCFQSRKKHCTFFEPRKVLDCRSEIL